MNIYVLINKKTGRFFPDTSELQEADVLRRDEFAVPNNTYVPLRVEYETSIKLSNIQQPLFVQISERNGEYIACAGINKQTTSDLQEALIYSKRDMVHNVLSLPVTLDKKNIKIV